MAIPPTPLHPMHHTLAVGTLSFVQTRFRAAVLPALLCMERLRAVALGPVRRRLAAIVDSPDVIAAMAMMKEVSPSGAEMHPLTHPSPPLHSPHLSSTTSMHMHASWGTKSEPQLPVSGCVCVLGPCDRCPGAPGTGWCC